MRTFSLVLLGLAVGAALLSRSPSRPRRLSSAPQTLITPMGAITARPAAGRIF